MLAGYYTVASGLMTRQREMDVIGNNLVNIKTPGYRADQAIISSFEQELLTRQEAYNTGVVGNGQMATSAIMEDVVSLFHTGTIKETGRNLDVAINGDGFYNIQTEGGVQLTRNGNFDIDAQGYLTLPGYGRVMGQNGAVFVGNDKFDIDESGYVYGQNGNILNRLTITMPAENANAVKQENGLFQIEGAAQQAADYTLIQGSLELSNVDMNSEMTTLMEAQRAFQACSSALQIVDAMNQKAATQLASI